MSTSNSSSSNSGCGCSVYVIPSLITSMIGYHIHGSVFWSIMDFIFWPITWVKWIIFHEVTLTIIKETFTWFFQ